MLARPEAIAEDRRASGGPGSRPEQYEVTRRGRHRAGVHRRVLGLSRRRHLRVRVLWRAAVLLGHEVRVGHGLAELLRRRSPTARSRRLGPRPRDGPHRGPVRQLRRAPRARVPRRSATRPAGATASTAPRRELDESEAGPRDAGADRATATAGATERGRLNRERRTPRACSASKATSTTSMSLACPTSAPDDDRGAGRAATPSSSRSQQGRERERAFTGEYWDCHERR